MSRCRDPAIPPQHRQGFYTLVLTYGFDMFGYALSIPVLGLLIIDPAHSILPTTASLAQRTVMLGFLLGSFSVTQAIAGPIVGVLADRIGRRRTFLATVFNDVIGYSTMAIGAAIGSLSILLIGRLWTGLSSANFGLALSTAADMSADYTRAKIFTRLFGYATLGFLIGPVVGGWLAHIPWLAGALPFAVVAFLKAFNLSAIWLWLTETLPPKRRAPHFREAIRLFISFANKRVFLILFLTYLLYCIGWNFFLQFQTILYKERFDLNAMEIGWMFAFQSAMWGLGILLLNPVILKMISLRHTVIWIPLLTGIGLILLGPSSKLFEILIILAAIPTFSGIYFTNNPTMISQLGAANAQGKLLGVNQTLWSVAQILGSVIGGVVAAINISLAMMVGGGIIVLAFVVGRIGIRKRDC